LQSHALPHVTVGVEAPAQVALQLFEPQTAVAPLHEFVSTLHSSAQGPSLQLSLAPPQASLVLQARVHAWPTGQLNTPDAQAPWEVQSNLQ
jgi:hypothetical protein